MKRGSFSGDRDASGESQHIWSWRSPTKQIGGNNLFWSNRTSGNAEATGGGTSGSSGSGGNPSGSSNNGRRPGTSIQSNTNPGFVGGMYSSQYHFNSFVHHPPYPVWPSATTSAYTRASTAPPQMAPVDDMLITATSSPDLEVPRQWENTGVGMLLNSNTTGSSFAGTGAFRFSLMSYNILAPGLLEKHAEIYRNCDPANLDWDARLNAIFKEINKYDPDIICLQEIENIQFEMKIEPGLIDLGYRGVFKQKTGDKDDGCAIFYKQTKFLLIDKLEVQFLQPHAPLLNRDNIALLLKLETRSVVKRHKIVVGTTHLLFNPKRHDVRLAQTQLLLAELDRFAFMGMEKDKTAKYHPILLTGDFNCQPQDPVTSLIAEGQLRCFDENGQMLKCFKSKVVKSLLPAQLGITDRCQHYKVALERYKRWNLTRANPVELDSALQELLVDLFPYIHARPILNSNGEEENKNDDVVSIYSPVAETIGELQGSLSEIEVSENTQFLTKAAQKLAKPVSSIQRSAKDPSKSHIAHLDQNVLSELNKLGISCEFGTGSLKHNFNFRDIHYARLDRNPHEFGVTTRQSGWICVDYIFQSMTWNNSLNKPTEGQLKLIRRLGLPSRNDCRHVGSIPNSHHPSDHFPLVAEFMLK